MSISKLRKPTAVEKRFKALFYGPAGSGKTTAAIQFPSPVLVDTEGGAENEQYVQRLAAAGGVYLGPRDGAMDFDVLLELCRDLLGKKHDYRTLVIDPLTVVYNEMLDKSASINGTEFGRHKTDPDRKIKHLLALLTRLDMNVIITSHGKPKWIQIKDRNGKDTAAQDGMTFDCYARLDYFFDLVIEVGRRGKERVGIVKKTRVEKFPEGEVIPFNYGEISERYGVSKMEAAASVIELATPEQVAEAAALAKAADISTEIIEKWWDKAGAAGWAEMPAEAIAKCIVYLKAKTTPMPA